jgi:hypothetical protein
MNLAQPLDHGWPELGVGRAAYRSARADWGERNTMGQCRRDDGMTLGVSTRRGSGLLDGG